MLKSLHTCLAIVALMGCNASADKASSGTTEALGDLRQLSDEFDGKAKLSDWRHIDQTEGWNADQLERFGVENGQLVLMPYASTWYKDYRGVLVYKDIPGDFVVTAKLQTTGRDGRSAPNSMFSLAGIMVRTPRSDTARNWQPGRENYIFLSHGSADTPGTRQFEVKTTEQSQSNLELMPASSSDATLRIAKIGAHIITLRQQNGAWRVHKRFYRADMPSSLQVGLTVYTDYPTASGKEPRVHNGMVIKGGRPDLIARVDYVRYARPNPPAGFKAGQATDADLLKLLGDSVD